MLLDAGANINTMDNYAFSMAAKNGHLGVVEYLVDNNYFKTNDLYYDSKCAAQNGHLEIIEFLCRKYGVNLFGDGALQGAAKGGHLNIVKFLYEQNIDVSTGDSALGIAAKNNHLEVVRFLYERGANIMLAVVQ